MAALLRLFCPDVPGFQISDFYQLYHAKKTQMPNIGTLGVAL